MKIVRDDDSNVYTRKALGEVNMCSGQEGHLVSTTNDLQKGDIFCVVFHWSAILEGQIEKSLRLIGCFGCNILFHTKALKQNSLFLIYSFLLTFVRIKSRLIFL